MMDTHVLIIGLLSKRGMYLVNGGCQRLGTNVAIKNILIEHRSDVFLVTVM